MVTTPTYYDDTTPTSYSGVNEDLDVDYTCTFEVSMCDNYTYKEVKQKPKYKLVREFKLYKVDYSNKRIFNIRNKLPYKIRID